MDFATTKDRLQSHLRECNRRYPDAWRLIDKSRLMREELGGWPEWCFCPLAGAYAVVSGGGVGKVSPGLGLEVGRVASLAAWRVSQGIYHIDQTILDAVMDTPLKGDLPVDILLTLPEWCLYVRTPGYLVEGRELHGFFAHLEHDMNDRRSELRIEMDFADQPPWESLSPEILHIKAGMNFTDGYAAMLTEMRRQLEIHSGRLPVAQRDAYLAAEKDVLRTAESRLAPIISILLYLCSQTAEYRTGGEFKPTTKPTRPAEKKTKAGWRLFPPDGPKIWFVGERLGEAIRAAEKAEREHQGDRSGPRPHVRRAHWHSFWRGSKADPDARKITLKWLPPIAVAMIDDSPEARMKIDRTKPIKNIAAAIDSAAAEIESIT